eukprot:1894802-Karenia_brevis.AAC.1
MPPKCFKVFPICSQDAPTERAKRAQCVLKHMLHLQKNTRRCTQMHVDTRSTNNSPKAFQKLFTSGALHVYLLRLVYLEAQKH